MGKYSTLLVLGLLTSTTAFASEPPASQDTTFHKFRIGGYGEMLATFMDYGLNRYYGGNGNTQKHHNDISIPRFVLSGDYKISNKWILGAEIEFEAGGTGSAYELEVGQGSENGEYEQEAEKGGEVAIEQFHITHLITPEFNIRAGHMIIPVGLTNTHHEPINFFTAARPEGATVLLPCTWHETGIEVFGAFGKGYASFDYEAMITAGLNPNGFNIYNWVKGGRQGFFETDNFSAPAYTARLNWTGVPGLRIGASVFFNPNAGKNADKLVTYDDLDDINIFIYSFDAQYVNRYVTARANFLSGSMTETVGIASKNRTYSSKSPYSRVGPIGKRVLDYSLELGLNVKSFFPSVKNFPSIYPFVHYNYYNPLEKVESGMIADKRCQVSMWSAGLNWKPIPGLIVKADYTTRQIGTAKIFGTSDFNSENEFRLGLAYTLWFNGK